MASFRDIHFGFAEAETESAQEPDLLLSGYFELMNATSELRSGQAYLVLGYKGSGKSATSQHLWLTAREEPDSFFTLAFLGDFPYEELRAFILNTGADGRAAHYPKIWAIILCLHLLQSFDQDEGSAVRDDPDFQRIVRGVRRLGLLPPKSPRQVFTRASKLSLKAISPLLQMTRDEGEPHPVLLLADVLKETVVSFASESEHTLVIDGLDDILASPEAQLESLAGLLLEVSRLNAALNAADAPAKVIVLCRTDLYERLPGTNKNKLRQDAAIVLDWYHQAKEPEQSHLVQLAREKARVSVPDIDDVFTEFLPDMIGGRPTVRFLLDHTRHTPRDFLQLLKHIQEFASREGPLTAGQVMDGASWYSVNYFMPEIRDELVGYLDGAVVDALFGLISHGNARTFWFEQVQKAAVGDPALAGVDLRNAFSCLFECSALGYISAGAYYTFRYRNRHSRIAFDERLVIHRGLHRALNLGGRVRLPSSARAGGAAVRPPLGGTEIRRLVSSVATEVEGSANRPVDEAILRRYRVMWAAGLRPEKIAEALNVPLADVAAMERHLADLPA